MEKQQLQHDQKVEGPIIIAMKGHPGTGKSTLAHSIASALKFPLLDKDDARDCTSTLENSLIGISTASKLLNDLCYEVLWKMASTQLSLGLGVIIDSPLSRKNHLDCLVQLAASAGARLLIVECKPKDEAEWRRRLDLRGRGAAGSGSRWHKPCTWDDLQKLLRGYDGCTDYDVGGVPKIVVDTTRPVGIVELVSSVLDFIASLDRPIRC